MDRRAARRRCSARPAPRRKRSGSSPKAADAAVMTRSIPIAKAWDDALIAYGQNGEPLRPEQGYPARLFLPGFEGNASVKWLRRIELADQPFMTREETSKYTDPLPDGTARIFSLDMDAKSLITEPAFPDKLTGPGLVGDPRHRVERPRQDHARRRQRRRRQDVAAAEARRAGAAEVPHALPPAVGMEGRRGGDHEPRDRRNRLRAADVRRAARRARAVDAYHFNHIRAWRVLADGAVKFAGGGRMKTRSSRSASLAIAFFTMRSAFALASTSLAAHGGQAGPASRSASGARRRRTRSRRSTST